MQEHPEWGHPFIPVAVDKIHHFRIPGIPFGLVHDPPVKGGLLNDPVIFRTFDVPLVAFLLLVAETGNGFGKPVHEIETPAGILPQLPVEAFRKLPPLLLHSIKTAVKSKMPFLQIIEMFLELGMYAHGFVVSGKEFLSFNLSPSASSRHLLPCRVVHFASFSFRF